VCVCFFPPHLWVSPFFLPGGPPPLVFLGFGGGLGGWGGWVGSSMCPIFFLAFFLALFALLCFSKGFFFLFFHWAWPPKQKKTHPPFLILSVPFGPPFFFFFSPKTTLPPPPPCCGLFVVVGWFCRGKTPQKTQPHKSFRFFFLGPCFEVVNKASRGVLVAPAVFPCRFGLGKQRFGAECATPFFSTFFLRFGFFPPWGEVSLLCG